MAAPMLGPRLLTQARNRLFEPLFDFAAVTEVIFTSVICLRFNAQNQGSPLNITCTQFPNIVVWIPDKTILPVIHQRGRPTAIAYLIDLAPQQQHPPGGSQAKVDFASLIQHLIDPFYVSFYESHYQWIRRNCGGDAYAWPSILNFARVMRNSVVHHGGRVQFDNPNAGPVQWYHLAYSPAENGRQAVGGDLGLADILILMFEIADELDRLGCPLNP
jgi:hypothetical protein